MQLCGSLSFLWHCLSLGLEWNRGPLSPSFCSLRCPDRTPNSVGPPLMPPAGCICVGKWLFPLQYGALFLPWQKRSQDPLPFWFSTFYNYCFNTVVHVSVLSRVWLFVTVWTIPVRFLCPWTSPRILEGVAISSSRGSSRPRDWTLISFVSCIGRQILCQWATWEALILIYQSWIFIGRTDAETETPVFWPPLAKNWLLEKDPDAGKD